MQHEHFDRQVLSSLDVSMFQEVDRLMRNGNGYSGHYYCSPIPSSLLLLGSTHLNVHLTLVNKMCIKLHVSSGQKRLRAGV